MIGDAGCARSFAGVASLVAAAALIATGALADGGSGTRPAVWAEYVETVGEIIAPLGPDFPLIGIRPPRRVTPVTQETFASGASQSAAAFLTHQRWGSA